MGGNAGTGGLKRLPRTPAALEGLQRRLRFRAKAPLTWLGLPALPAATTALTSKRPVTRPATDFMDASRDSTLV